MDVYGCNDAIIPMGKTAQHSNTFRSNERSVGRVLDGLAFLGRVLALSKSNIDYFSSHFS